MDKTEIDFVREVREVVCAIPRGKVLTYGDVASLAGRPANARQVGHILGNIGFDSEVPCHRVVNAQGRPAPHWHAQKSLLEAEGISFTPTGRVQMPIHRWTPDW